MLRRRDVILHEKLGALVQMQEVLKMSNVLQLETDRTSAVREVLV
jgi:hypothetical protein